MALKRPSYHQGAYYHFYNRGANRNPIFFDDRNYFFVIRKLHEYAHALDIDPVAYCLMPNHYHFLVQQMGEQPAGLLPQRIFNAYTKAINKEYFRTGTLFEGPYRVKEIRKESHLIHLCRYIHANPVKDGLCKRPDEWAYSDYKDWIAVREGKATKQEFFNSYFHDRQTYVVFVQDYIDTKRTEEAIDDDLLVWENN